MNNKIRTDCFWYRPWKDMNATIDQCNLTETAKCPCDDDCKWYITNAEADEIIWSMLQTKQIETNHKLFKNANKDNGVWWTPN